MNVIARLALVLVILAAGLVIAAPPAQAIIFEFTSDHCTGGCGTPPFGTVEVTQVGANVDITVHLFDGSLFVKSGAGDFMNFKFNGTGVALGDIIVDPHVPVLAAAAGAFNGDGTGDFGFGITCPSCGNGGAGGFGNDIEFTVLNATIADLTAANNLGNIFVADILSGQTGFTGPVDVTAPRVSEPSALLFFGTAMVLAGTFSRRWMRR